MRRWYRNQNLGVPSNAGPAFKREPGLSMTLDSLLSVVTSNNGREERITDSEVF